MTFYPKCTMGVALAELVGERIRETRHARGLRQVDLAKLIGTHRPIVTRVESGKHGLLLPTIFEYAQALEVSAAYLVAATDIGFDWSEWPETMGYDIKPTKSPYTARDEL